jgi:hypothetical protein
VPFHKTSFFADATRAAISITVRQPCGGFLGANSASRVALSVAHHEDASLARRSASLKAMLRVLGQGEWVLITDDDDPERVWRDEESALAELKQQGWGIEVGPATLHAEVPDQQGRKVCGYILRRSVH